MFRTICVAAASVWLACAGAACAAETGQFGADLVDAIVAADAAHKPPPRLADAVWGQRFKTALDPAVVAGLDPDDIQGMVGVCQAVNNVTLAYLDYGVRRTAGSSTPGSQESLALLRAQMANTNAYQDEVNITTRFIVACFAKTLKVMTDFSARLSPEDWNDARRKGAAMMRDGMVMIYVGVVQSATGLDKLRPANRDLILDEAVAHAEIYAASMRPSDRLKVRNTIDAALHGSGLAPDVRAKLAKIAVAMSRKDCAGLCAA